MNYKNPKELLEHFNEYKNHVHSNPRTKVDFIGRDATRVEIPLRVPLTIEGFENYVYDKYNFSIHDYLYSSEDRYKPFSTVRSRVKTYVRQDQIEGGMVGQYNPSITQRLNNLSEKQEHNIKAEVNIPNVPDIGDRK